MWALVSLVGTVPSTTTVTVVGAHGALGRELVYQALARDWKVNAVVRRDDPLYRPTRRGWLSPSRQTDFVPMRNAHLRVVDAREADSLETPAACDAVVFALSGSPFAADTSTDVVRRTCASLPSECKKVCLVSAHGVGPGGTDDDVGIRVMRAWYLKDVYAEKRAQEAIVATLDDRIDTLVLRPRVLSYGRIPLNPISVPRSALAARILDWVACETT